MCEEKRFGQEQTVDSKVNLVLIESEPNSVGRRMTSRTKYRQMVEVGFGNNGLTRQFYVYVGTVSGLDRLGR